MRLNTSGFTDFKNFDKILEKEVDRMETWWYYKRADAAEDKPEAK